jgi:DNA-binding NarL/FixJ family response regulator
MSEPPGDALIGRKHHGRVPLALIVDDHPLFCEALSMTLRSALEVDQVETAASLAGGLERLSHKPAPDVILLDLKLPDVEGLDGLIRLKRAAAGVPIIVVSSLSDDRVIASAIHAGASGFIPKHSQRAVFVQAFDQIWAGDVYTPEGFVPPGEHGGAVDETDALERLSQLTQQQARILQLVCEGKLNKQIAFDLDIAETTVKAHLTAILRKLNVQSRTQAVLIAQNARFAAILQSDSGLS